MPLWLPRRCTVVTIGTVATVCQDFASAIGSFNDTEGGDSQTVTNLASHGRTERT